MSFLLGCALIFSSEAAFADAASCAAAKKALADTDANITTLEGQRDSSLYAGSAMTLYTQKMAALETQAKMYSEEIVLDCAPGDVSGSGLLEPRYMVLTLVYAAPGSGGGKDASYVDYGTESATGSKVSLTQSYKDTNSVTATVSAGAFGSGTSVAVGFDSSQDQADKSEVDIKKDAKSDIKAPGPPADGIDHDYDQIWLWLNPQINVTFGNSATDWVLGTNGNVAVIQFVYVKWLKQWIQDPATVATNDVGKALQQQGFTTEDYSTLLKLDPFATGQTAVDASRFAELAVTFPFEPTLSSAAQPGTESYSISNETTVSVRSSPLAPSRV